MERSRSGSSPFLRIAVPVIRLPDGSSKTFDRAVTVAEVAQSIGAGLAHVALDPGRDHVDPIRQQAGQKDRAIGLIGAYLFG